MKLLHTFRSIRHRLGAGFLLALTLAISPVSIAHAATVRIYLNPGSGNVVAGNGLSTQIRLTRDVYTSLEAVQADISFPANLLSVASVSSADSSFNQSGSLTASWDNNGGSIHITGHDTTARMASDLLVATINFTAKAPGTANVVFAASTKAGSYNNATKDVTTNKIDSSTGGQYGIAPAPVPAAPVQPHPVTPTAPSTPAPQPSDTPTADTPPAEATTADPSTSSGTTKNAAPHSTASTAAVNSQPKSAKSMVWATLLFGLLLLIGGFIILLARRRRKQAHKTTDTPSDYSEPDEVAPNKELTTDTVLPPNLVYSATPVSTIQDVTAPPVAAVAPVEPIVPAEPANEVSPSFEAPLAAASVIPAPVEAPADKAEESTNTIAKPATTETSEDEDEYYQSPVFDLHPEDQDFPAVETDNPHVTSPTATTDENGVPLDMFELGERRLAAEAAKRDTPRL